MPPKLRQRWLDRYSLEEIVAMAEAVWPGFDVSDSYPALLREPALA